MIISNITQYFDLVEFLEGKARVAYLIRQCAMDLPKEGDFRYFGQRFTADETGTMPTVEAAKLHAQIFTDGVEKGLFSVVMGELDKPGTTWMPLNDVDGKKRGLIVTFVILNCTNSQFNEWLKGYYRANRESFGPGLHDSAFGITP